MLVGIPVIVNTVHRPFQFYQIHVPVDLPDRVRICRLDTDLQLDQTWAHLSDQFQLLLVKDIRGNLEVEVRDPVIMLHKVPPDPQRVFSFAVEGAVHKFDLWDLVVQEKLQFREYQIETPEAHRLIDGRKTVTAGKRTPAAALIVDDPVLESCHIIIVEWDLIETEKTLQTMFLDLAAFRAVRDPRNMAQLQTI